MSGNSTQHKRLPTAVRVLAWLVAAVMLTMAALAFALKLWLATPQAADRAARLLTGYLHQPVTMAGLEFTGGSLQIRGVSLANPPGFPAGPLVVAETVIIAPHWRDLLAGRRSLRLVELQGLWVALCQNGSGAWNFAPLQQLLTSGTGGGRELFLDHLIVRDSLLQVNDLTVNGIALQVDHLTTRGSRQGTFELSFEDAGGNRYTVSGSGRSGNHPALDLSLAAPALKPGRIARPGTGKLPWPTGGTADLQLSATLRDGLLRAGGRLAFRGLAIPPVGNRLPLSGSLAVQGDYDLRTGSLRLKELNLAIDRLLKARATGTLDRAGQGRSFSADIRIDEARPEALASLLPGTTGRRPVIGGVLDGTLHLAGSSATGLSDARGSFRLHGGSLIREGRLLVTGLEGQVGVARTGADFSVTGKLTAGSSRDRAMLEALEAPFRMTLSSRLHPLTAESSAFSARVMGMPLSGSLGFRAEAPDPFRFALQIPSTPLATIAPLLPPSAPRIDSGRLALELEGKGRGATDFSATAHLQLTSLATYLGKTGLAMRLGRTDLTLGRAKGHASAAGTALLTGLTLDGKPADAAFSYGLRYGVITLANSSFRYNGITAGIAALSGIVPTPTRAGGTTRYPLDITLSGGNLHRGQLALEGLAARLRGVWATDREGKWLEGGGDLTLRQVSWQGRAVAAPSLHLDVARSGGRAIIGGTVLGGAASGTATFQPLAPAEGGSVQLHLSRGRLAAVAGLLPAAGGFTLTDGLLDSNLSGTCSRNGCDGHFTVQGTEIAVTRGAKALPATAAVSLAGTLTGNRLEIGAATISASPAVSLKLHGAVADLHAPLSAGMFAFELSRTTLNDMLAPFVNILPRFVQEATLDGSVAGRGSLELQGGKKLLAGTIQLDNAGMAVPSQQLSVAGITGSIPFSLDLAGAATTREPGGLSFSKDNYPRLLAQFRQPPSHGTTLHVGSAAFGPLELGALTLRADAADGITRVTSLRSSLFGGELFGTGHLAMAKGLTWRGDLLVNGLSLKQLCTAFPKINGYISGRLDGIISLNSRGNGLRRISGFTDLWAREGGGERMLVSREFLQRLSGKKLSGFFFRDDRPYDQAEIEASLEQGYLTFDTLDIRHTNMFGVRDLSVTIAPSQNRIALDHLIDAVKQAAVRGKAAAPATEAPAEPEFKWQE